MHYSLSTGGFYLPEIHGDLIPADAVEISDSMYQDLLTKQAEGFRIVADDNGYPIAVAPPPLTLDQLKELKKIEIQRAVQNAITGGIECDALGSVFIYPTATNDQINMTGLITETLLSSNDNDFYLFWCADMDGVWSRRSHTKLQIQIVGKKFASHIKFEQEKYAALLAEIAIAEADQLTVIKYI